METMPSDQPARVFRTGRNLQVVGAMVSGALAGAGAVALVLLPALYVRSVAGAAAAAKLLATYRTELRQLDVFALVWLAVLSCSLFVLAGGLLVFLRENVAVHTQGVVATSWLGRRRFVRWADLEGVGIGRIVPMSGTVRLSWMPLYLLVRHPHDETARLVVARLGSEFAYREIASAMAERAGLEYVGDNLRGLDAGEEVWRRRPGSSEGSAPQPPADAERRRLALLRTATAAPPPGPASTTLTCGKPDLIFPTARTTVAELLMYVPLVAAALGLLAAWVCKGEGGILIGDGVEVNVILIGGLLVGVVGGVMGLLALVAHVRSALLVYGDGLVLRSWRGRRRFIAWSDLQGIVATYAPEPATGIELSLVVRHANGENERLAVSTATFWGRTHEDLTTTLAQRAHLEYLGRQQEQELWRTEEGAP